MLAARRVDVIFSRGRHMPAMRTIGTDMNALVRRAIPQDAESIATVHIETWQHAYRGQLPDSFLDRLSDELSSRTKAWRSNISVSRPNTEIWVTGSEGRADSFVALGPARGTVPDRTGEIYAIYVHPQFWDRGLGRALFARANERLISLEFTSAILWVLESNRRARRFYEIAGWNLEGPAKTETHPGGIELREVCYRRVFPLKEEQ